MKKIINLFLISLLLGLALIASATEIILSPTSPKTTVPTTISSVSIFTKNLTVSSYGTDVMALKKIISLEFNTTLDTSATFTSNTTNDVKKLQEKYAREILAPLGLTSGTGIVGPSTRKKLNLILNNILVPKKASGNQVVNNNSSSTTSSNSSSKTVVEISPIPAVPPIANKIDSFAPTIMFEAYPIKVIAGQLTTLAWNTSNADGRCEITSKDSSGKIFKGTIDSSGQTSIDPINKTTTYTIVCYNKYGIPGSKSVLVEVIDSSKTAIQPIVYAQMPKITSISPSSANRGDTVTIIGSSFVSTSTVIFDGIKIDNNLVTSKSSSSISFKIPEYTYCLSAYCPSPTIDTTVETGGRKIIQVSNTNGFSNDFAFTLPSKKITISGVSTVTIYTPPKLSIDSIKPASGTRGSTAVISGAGFSTDSIILFGGFKVANNLIISRSSNSMSFVIPQFQFGCTEPEYEICPRLPIFGSGTIIETGGTKTVYITNTSNKSTSTSVIFTLPSQKITY
ncbi:MAG: hypothetical protein ABIF22_00650 [bacterium]